MARSATDTVQDIINAAVVDAVVALKDASKGLPNAMLRDVNAIHANTAFADLPEAVRAAVASSVRDAFAKLRKDGYVVAEAKSLQVADARQEPRSSGSPPSAGQRRPASRTSPKGRPRPNR
jgi:cation transport regulator ChaB